MRESAKSSYTIIVEIHLKLNLDDIMFSVQLFYFINVKCYTLKLKRFVQMKFALLVSSMA